MKKLLLATLFLFLFFVPLSARAEQVTLAWDANTESDLAGYKVYWGTTTAVYDNSIDVGNETSKTVIALVEGQTYYFAVTAYDTSKNESDYSNEFIYTVPVIDTTPPSVPKNLRKVIVEVSINEDGTQIVVKAELGK